MGNQVKTKLNQAFAPQVEGAGSLGPRTNLWTVSFGVTLLVFGALLGYGVMVPLFLLGFIFPVCNVWTEFVLHRGTSLLMNLQTWYQARLSIAIEPKSSSRKPQIILSNHRSHLDAFLFLATIPGVRMLARKSLFFIPFLGGMMRITRQIPAKRGMVTSLQRAMEELKLRALEGQNVLIFPEMTRCQPGFDGIQPFSILPFQMALQIQAEIIPVVLKGTDQVWPKGKWGIVSNHLIQAFSLPKICASQFESSAELRDAVWKSMNEAYRAKIQ